MQQYEGGYSDYLIRKELEGLDTEMSLKGHAAATEGQSKKGENSSKDTWKQRKSKLKFTYKEQREFETIDDDIAKLEEKLETLAQNCGRVPSAARKFIGRAVKSGVPFSAR